MAFARTLAQLDTREGLEENLKIKWRNTTILQILDHEGVPLCCQCYHKVGHIYKECPLLSKHHPPPASLHTTRKFGQSTDKDQKLNKEGPSKTKPIMTHQRRVADTNQMSSPRVTRACSVVSGHPPGIFSSPPPMFLLF